jgi:hypothetical protein
MEPGYYDQSYPPSLWQTPVAAAADDSQVSAARAEDDRQPITAGASESSEEATGSDVSPTTLTVAAGTPGTYDPAVSAVERPRNLTELRQRGIPEDTTPWPAGAYVLVGTSGKRAHWSGSEWRADESPGYVPESSADTPDVQFPGTYQRNGEDLTR